MKAEPTHEFRFRLERLSDGHCQAELGGRLATWIDLEDKKWRCHPEGDGRFVGVGETLVDALLDHLTRRLGTP